MCGPLPVVHHLGHGCGYTTHGSVLAGAHIREQDVERIVLRPSAGYQRGDGSSRLQGWCSLCSPLQGLDLGGIAVQQLLHGFRNVLGVEGALVAVAQHRRSAVVTGHDDVAAAGVEHIVGSLVAPGAHARRLLGGLQGVGRHLVTVHKLGGDFARLALGNGASQCCAGQCQAHHDKQQSSFFHVGNGLKLGFDTNSLQM